MEYKRVLSLIDYYKGRIKAQDKAIETIKFQEKEFYHSKNEYKRNASELKKIERRKSNFEDTITSLNLLLECGIIKETE